MRILQVTTVAKTLRSFLLPLGERFRANGWHVDAMASGATSCAQCRTSFDRVWDIDWSRDPTSRRNFLSAPNRVRQVVAQGNYDVVHVHTPIAAFVTRYAIRQRISRPQVIYTAHGFAFHAEGSPWNNLLFLQLEKLAGRWTDCLVLINRDDARAARRHRISRGGSLYIPGIGIDTDRYAPASVTPEQVASFRASLHLAPDDVLFGVVAYMDPDKRHEDIIWALHQLRRSYVHLALAGDGPQMDELRNLVHQLGLARQVHFLGHCSQIPVLLRACRAKILSSVREGLPRSVMEAMSLEVPVIGSDVRGICDLLEEGGGLLVPPQSVTAFSRAMAWMVDHPQEAQAMGVCARQIVKCYDVKRILSMYEALYQRIRESTSTSGLPQHLQTFQSSLLSHTPLLQTPRLEEPAL